MYYVNACLGGKTFSRSLKTTVEEVAISRRDKFLADTKATMRRQNRQNRNTEDLFKTIMLSALKERARRMDQNPKTTEYNEECAKIITRLFPKVETSIKQITPIDMNRLQDALHDNYSASRHNGCLSVLNWTFAKGLSDGLIAHSPSVHLKRRTQKAKDFFLPTDEQFREVLQRLKERKNSEAWALVIVLALTGCRLTEAEMLTVGDVDWADGLITIRAQLKNGGVRIQPILDDLAPSLKGLCQNRPASDRLLLRKDARRELTAVSSAMGLPRITHHTLRKYFITKALEAGIDPFTVASWVGHKDIKTTMEHYHKIRMKHSKKEAKKMDFGLDTQTNVIPMVREK